MLFIIKQSCHFPHPVVPNGDLNLFKRLQIFSLIFFKTLDVEEVCKVACRENSKGGQASAS